MQRHPDRNEGTIIQSEVQIKDWLKRLPRVEEVRPGACPVCQRASRPLGQGLRLWGHGLRQRQVRGPLSPQGAPQLVTVRVRRYQCQECGATVQVGPRGLLRRRHYAAAAVALAMCLYGLLGLSAAAVRKAVSPWTVVGAAAAGRWATLLRWGKAARNGTLYPSLRKSPAEFSLRLVAQRVAMAAVAAAPPGPAWRSLPEACFLGGAHLL